MSKIYNFHYKWGEKKEYGKMVGVILADGTEIALMSKTGLYVKYPKKKFKKIIEPQLTDKKSKYINLLYDAVEVEAMCRGLMKGLKALQKFAEVKRKRKKKEAKNGRKVKR